MDKVISRLARTCVYSDTWEEHILPIQTLFDRHATVQFLDHQIGQGKVAPLSTKIQSICEYLEPLNKKIVMIFLGMAGFYGRFCPNLSHVVANLTNLLKEVKYVWSDSCLKAFDTIKTIMLNITVLKAPDFVKEFLVIL